MKQQCMMKQQVVDRTLGIVVCGYHYEKKVWLQVQKMCDFCWYWIRRELKERIIENFGLEYIEHWDQIIDGFDKLKSHGFTIHVCIDGYSRKNIWMDVSASNKCPDLIAYYYLKAAKNVNGIPKIIKADNGTGHSIMEPIHTFSERFFKWRKCFEFIFGCLIPYESNNRSLLVTF